MKKSVFDVIEKFEPRVVVLDVVPSDTPDSNNLDVQIIFRIINSERPISVKASLQRVR